MIQQPSHSGRDPWFDRPFDRLTVLSKVEGLTVLSRVEGLTVLSRVDAEPFGLELTAERQRRSIKGESRKVTKNQIILDPPPNPAGDDALRHGRSRGRASAVSSTERSGRESINVQLSVFRSIGVSDRVCFLFKNHINFSIFPDSKQIILG